MEQEKRAVLPEIEAILNEKISGAEKIRRIYDLDPASFDAKEISKVSGINIGRIKGAIDKYTAEKK
jgi:hypothetical protein